MRSRMYIGFHVKCPLFLSDCNESWIFSTVFRKIPNFMKILLFGTEMFHADGRTDMTELTVTFCNYVNSPKNWHFFTNLIHQNTSVHISSLVALELGPLFSTSFWFFLIFYRECGVNEFLWNVSSPSHGVISHKWIVLVTLFVFGATAPPPPPPPPPVGQGLLIQ